jgi:hypothetical protein
MVRVRHDYKPAVCLLGECISPFDLWKYRITVTSYSHLTTEVNRVARFQDAVEDYKAGLTAVFPKRPKLVFLSGSLESDPCKPMGKCMILDEAHVIRNRNTRTFAAVTSLHEQFEDCMALT